MGQKACGVVLSSVWDCHGPPWSAEPAAAPPSTLHPCPSLWTLPGAGCCPCHPVPLPGAHPPCLPRRPLVPATLLSCFHVLDPSFSPGLSSVPCPASCLVSVAGVPPLRLPPTPQAPLTHSAEVVEVRASTYQLGARTPRRSPRLLAGSSALHSGLFRGRLASACVAPSSLD